MVTAHVKSDPAAIAETPVLNPETGTGRLDPICVPLPSWPSLLLPQQKAAPALVTAQVCDCPAAMRATSVSGAPPAESSTCTGAADCVYVPLPSCPFELSPQHQTVPSVVKAQVDSDPAAMETALEAQPHDLHRAGDASAVVPLPKLAKF